MLKSGLYEQIIYKRLRHELERDLERGKMILPIDDAEAPKALSAYLSEVIERVLEDIGDRGGNIQTQIDLVNKLVDTVTRETKNFTYGDWSVDEKAEQLLAILDRQNTINALNDRAPIIRPDTSLSMSSLFTGAVHEPSMMSELKKEIASADRIDMLVSFIKWSGLRLIFEELKAFVQNGGTLRIITTSYMGATDPKAIEELSHLPNTEIRISYDTRRTRLHAKTYVFYRDTGFTTAYVGSSNLSNAAISSGLEWNVKVTAKDLPETIKKIDATFESYWNSTEFESYSEKEKLRLQRALRAEKYAIDGNAQPFLFDITPYPYQQEILDRLDAERKDYSPSTMYND